MRILIVSNSFGADAKGGAEAVALRCARFLHDHHDVSVLCATSLPGERPEEFPVYTAKYRNLYSPTHGASGKGPLSRAMFHAINAVGGIDVQEVRACIDQVRPDLIYAHNSHLFQPQLMKIAGSLGLPYLVHIHDYFIVCPKISMYKDEVNCARQCVECKVLTSAWRHASSVVGTAISVSEFVRDRHISLGAYPNASWHVLRNVETPRPSAMLKKGPDRKAQGILTLGYLGALTPAKGIEDLIRAFKGLPRENMRLIIGGTGESGYVQQLKSSTDGIAIEWLGHVSPDEVYSQADIMVVPSRWHDPQPLVVVETLNRGLPIVAARRGGITETVEDYPKACLYDPDTDTGLADMLEKAICRFGQKSPRTEVTATTKDLENRYNRKLLDILETIESSATQNIPAR